MTDISRRIHTLLVLATAVVLASWASGSFAKTYDLKIGFVTVKGPQQGSSEFYKKEIEKRTNGRIKVQIFDLSGRLVFEAEEAGARLDWHTDNMYGEFLANGIYLYKLYVWIGDKWVVSEVRKLAIFR